MSDIGLSDYPLFLKAGKWQKLAVPGNYITIAQGTGWVNIRPDSGAVFARRAGSGTPVVNYTYVEFMSVADQNVVVSLGLTLPGAGPYDSGAVFAGTVNVVANLPSLNAALADVVIAAGTSTMVALADVTRLTLAVQLDDGAVGPVRVGDSSVDGSHGLKLQPDDTAVCEGSPPVYVFNPNASSVTVHLFAEYEP